MQHETDLCQNPDARSMRHTPFVSIHTSPAGLAARVGKFMLQNRVPLHTPHYISSTSRGAVPHISPDIVRNSTAIKSLYVGLEDFLEKWPQPIPILKTPLSHTRESRLRKFIAAQDDDVLILAPRRAKAVVNPLSNGPDSVAILTSTGSWSLKHSLWLEMVEQIQPDIVVGFADLMPGHTPGVKRREKMVDRTHAYTRDATRYLYADADSKGLADNDGSDVVNEENNNRHTPLYFAPILPLENTQQALYLQDLEDGETCSHISGLALYESASLSIVPENLNHLLRFCQSDPWTPQEILRDIALGADLFTIPMIDDTSNAGIAMVFTFQPSSSSSSPSSSTSPLPTATTTQEQHALKPTAPAPKPLALDLWNKKYSTDLSPITEGCTCYSCRTHHRAYIHHLLSAKEMLGWTLLQIHNHHVMDLFFAAVRQSISNNTFEEDVASFEREYEFAFPTQTGQGPRIRGYTSHLSKAGEPPRNPPAYGRLNDALEKYDESLQSSVATPDTNAEGLERHGFAEKSSDL